MRAVVLICDRIEWRAVCDRFPGAARQAAPSGEWFSAPPEANTAGEPTVFIQSGVGKIAAAAAAQYAIDRWAPELLINFGTCGGFAGAAAPGEILLAERTVVYDILGQMAGSEEVAARYATTLDLSWLAEPLPLPARRCLLLSADRDLVPADVPRLAAEFGAIAGDWESGAIAYVAARNGTRCLILRGVSDLVGSAGGEAYDNLPLYVERARAIMGRLLDSLPGWLAQASR